MVAAPSLRGAVVPQRGLVGPVFWHARPRHCLRRHRSFVDCNPGNDRCVWTRFQAGGNIAGSVPRLGFLRHGPQLVDLEDEPMTGDMTRLVLTSAFAAVRAGAK